MEIVPSIMESARPVMLGMVMCEVGNTPCNLDSEAKELMCRTPNVTVMTHSSETAEAEEGLLRPNQSETVSKPPLVRTMLPLRELDLKLSETENVPRRMEMASKAMPVKAVAAPKEMPFKERNREEGKRMIPPHIKVPPKKLFGYPERYKSPTDAMVSPISKGLLARNRRPARTLAPVVPPKALENTFQDVVVDGEVGNSE
ncbi:hypothetical protein MPTK1_1g00810 [Marchantia polymorpha subsp. ruderalis]|uniref:Uncharacterized protein n=2 Tax=Marchantia polymorpha TaxID=3197 RepID=A0A176WE58_MARPO|nr:hypothetical protein AXG93_2815s1020 [Marchantia polymorpha subsp. ruderalis]PTQ32032.1 hypothetical protein MARPO_0103s0008 [Marchantia polymorpha]BBM96796.1 hypothetical protein Mp_1g00810 [Marchantia polymorpha subsp. ruderalis]|eukprot:PTQ32032.1 hypothetical protein MARPO_0103s0008 [Marchantia polymorpha]